MKKELLNILCCPNTSSSGFEVFAARLERDGEVLYGIHHANILPNDEIIDGLAFSEGQPHVYPIRYGVLVMLADSDVDCVAYRTHLVAFDEHLAVPLRSLAWDNLERLGAVRNTSTGSWNREEMKYYDAEVDDVDKREAMFESIRTEYYPHIFIPRKKYILDSINNALPGNNVLEIGCGNA